MEPLVEPLDVRPQANAQQAVRRWLLRGLAALWLLDGVLQLQPGMFTRALLTAVWQPATVGQPVWLATLMGATMRLAAHDIATFNAAIVAVQLGLGCLLLTRRPGWVRIGLWGSLGFSVLLWVCAQGMGQVLTGSATLLTGAPGSAAVYAAIALLLLLPEAAWGQPDLPARVGGGFLLLGALLQLSPSFWTPLGLAQPFGEAFMMPQPAGLRAAIGVVVNLAGAWPLALNAALVLGFAAAGIAALLAPQAPRLWAVLVLLGLVWVFGQDAGMLWSGMATDPNTAPALFLLVLAPAGARTSRGRAPVRTAERHALRPSPR